MSRTIHHVPYKHRSGLVEDLGRERWFTWPRTAHLIRALRYSAAVERAAEQGGFRVRPVPVTRRLEAYDYRRTYGDRSIAIDATTRERALRAATRVAARRAVQLLRVTPDAALDVDFPDPRHRRGALWDA
jgi:hypothetical protein